MYKDTVVMNCFLTPEIFNINWYDILAIVLGKKYTALSWCAYRSPCQLSRVQCLAYPVTAT